MTKITAAALKRPRVSKKSKKSWRKHTNLTDVEEFLEDQRLEERLGPPLSTLSNDELFQLDTKPSKHLLALKQKRKERFLQPPKCFAALRPHTNVPDPITKRNRVRTKEERKNELIKKKEAENRAKGILKARELQALKDRKLTEEKKKCAYKRGDFNVNIWNDEENHSVTNEWIGKNTDKHNLVLTGKNVKTAKRVIKKNTVLPSVKVPHPGMSYNPSYADHQDLLKIVADKEAKIIKEEKHLNRVTRDMFKTMTPQKRDASWLEEMSQGLQQIVPAENEEDTDDEYKTINPPVENKKKTLKQRRKQKEQLKLELMRKAAKLEKKKVSDIHQLKVLHKEIAKKESRATVLREKRKKIKLLKEKEPKRLGPIKFEDPELEFNMGMDLAGNLRNLKKEGNLLKDRFKSLQERNIIQPSIRRHQQRAKVKVFTKPGHKEDWIKTVAR